ncbi:MtnX-like HAD-IB family phosphatase [Dyella sp. 333MFSha]|uniref:MtnX-like HAD-IB family phosphatase n=1 Tax=Dyella sp. 333MFSha TaxID=1798240 RepID=UPI00087E8FD3|nr:MtnX-like HAD-IB family phosphatase [Dyella sp. 333MFSha]SDF90719.1 Haloacid Dehalogenase superfamily, subfamily IB, phosphoserine phosphatase-like/2,3-diketo-5-methylthio-1-phosphopentane phosphatase [Dyella sp. 333MFSha]
MSSPSSWNILCDFDGTIAVEDVIDSLLDRYGRPGWEILERDWRAGVIGSAVCMAGQVALLDMSRDELARHLNGLHIDHGFASFVRATIEYGVPMEIVSDGLDHAIHAILANHGIDTLPTVANHLLQSGPRDWSLTSPFSVSGCRAGTCKCARVEAANARGGKTLLIGDGASDFCAADRVDFVFAKNRLIEHCRAAGIPYAPIASFDEARELLPELLAGRLPAQTVIPLHATSSQELPA